MTETERLDSLANALNAVHKRVQAEMGDDDVVHVKRLNVFSRSMEVLGRVLIHVSFEPVSFSAGVLCLWVHKQLQATEIGHPVLHGCYDKLDGAESFHSKTWKWDIPIDEEAWHKGHNLGHHPNTNVAGKDPDILWGPVRLNEHTEHRWWHYGQLPYTLLSMWPGFAWGMNLHFTGTLDMVRPPERRMMRKERSWAQAREALWMAARKYVPYYAKNYVFFPALAGPFWWKVLLGNWLAEVLRNVYSAASIFCGHIGEDVADYGVGTKPGSKGRWYEMQIEAAHNFEVPYAVSVLCGGLDYQIEHHLFPRLPPERLRQIAPEVRQICADHGVTYRTGSWPRVLFRALAEIGRLSFPTKPTAPAPAA